MSANVNSNFRSIRKHAAFVGVSIVAAAMAIALVWIGVQQALAPICSEWMYARGWACFTAWILVALLATPFRASGSSAIRAALHGAAWMLAWGWWSLAIAFADLHSRADLLWVAYIATGVAIAGWRLWLHGMLLRLTVRLVLRRSDDAPGLVRFAGGEPISSNATPSCLSDRVLDGIARVRGLSRVRRAHEAVFGPSGHSRIILDEIMRKTDEVGLELREALRAESGQGSPEIINRAATRLARVFCCETAVWLGIQDGCDEDPIGDSIQARAIAVYSLISLCVARKCVQSCPEFVAALSRLAERSAASIDTPRMLEAAGALKTSGVERYLRDIERVANLSIQQRVVVWLATASALARLRLYRPARGVLGRGKHELEFMTLDEAGASQQESLHREAIRTLQALTSEIDSCAVSDATPTGSTEHLSDSDRAVIEQRRGLARFHREAGAHPLSDVIVKPSDFARLPTPRRPREIGVGAFAIVVAFVAWAAAFPIPAVHPLVGRLQTVYDVPLGGEIASTGVRAATVAATNGAATVLLADPTNGIRKMDLRSLRSGREGGPGTAVDGLVRALATNPDGSSLAIFDAKVNGSACISARDQSARWSPIIAPASLSVDGSAIEAALPGFTEPLLLCERGANRLLRYDENARSLREAATTGAVTIEGRFTDCAEFRAKGGARCAVLLTTLPTSTAAIRAHAYHISESPSSTTLSIRTIPLPPLERRGLVAVAVDDSERLVAVDSSGGAWTASLESPTPTWERIRPGDQGLQLDSVDLAVVTDAGKRLWFIRKGEVWSRRLAPNDSDPSDGDGWVHAPLPPSAVACVGFRPTLLEVSGDADSLYLLSPAPKDGTQSGSVLSMRIVAAPTPADGGPTNTIALNEYLRPGEQLLDADALGDHALLAVATPERSEGGGRSLQLDLLERGRRNIRTAPQVVIPNAAERFEQLVSIHDAGESAIALFSDGTFIRFDPRRDVLVPAMTQGTALVGNIALPQGTRDAAIISTSSGAVAHVLDAGGSVREIQLASTPQPTSLLVDGTDGPPSEVISNARFVVTDTSGAMMFSPSAAWRFSTANAADPFTDETLQLGVNPTGLLPTTTAEGAPAIAWLANGGAEFRYFAQGSFGKTALQSPLHSLLPGLGNSCFGSDGSGALWSLPIGGAPTRVMAVQQGGPQEVIGSAIRASHVDFLGMNSLHSIDRSSGDWSVSPILHGVHSIHSVGALERGATILIPASAGTPSILPSGEPAANLLALGQLGAMEGMQVFGEGVLGVVQQSGDLGWVSTDGKQSSRLPNREVPGLNLASVHEAVVADSQLYLRGSSFLDDSPTTVVRTSLDGSPASVFRTDEARAMELGSESLFVLGSTALFALDPTTLVTKSSWKLDGADHVVLGRANGFDPAIADANGIALLGAQGPVSMMRCPKPDGFSSLRQVAAWENRIMAITDDGAWERSDRADRPFTRNAKIGAGADLVVFSPDAAAPWVRVRGEWTSPSNGDKVGSSIGWTQNGAIVQTPGIGSLQIGPASIPGFTGAPNAIGDLGGLERLDGATALLLGRTGAVLFDMEDRLFPRTDELLAQLTSDVRIFDRANGPMLAWTTTGKIVIMDRTKPRELFGGKPVASLLAEPAPIAILKDKTLVDETGQAIGNAPPSSAGTSTTARSAVGIGTGIYRIVDGRTIDQFDTVSMASRTMARKADALGRAGQDVLAFDRVGKVVFSLKREREWPAQDWFVGSRSIAILDTNGVVSITDGGPEAPSSPQTAPLPGQILGNIAGSTVVLTRNDDGTHSLFDALDGVTIAPSIPGRDHAIGRTAVYCVDERRNRVQSIDLHGISLQSSGYDSVCIAPDGNDVTAIGLRAGDAFSEVVLLDAPTLRESAPLLKLNNDHALLATSDADPTRFASLDQRRILLVGGRGFGFDDGSALASAPNPLGTSAVTLRLGIGRLLASDAKGNECTVLTLTAAGWKLAVSPVAPAAKRSLLGRAWRQTLELRVVTDVAPELMKLSVGTLELATGWLQERRPTKVDREQSSITVRFADGRKELVYKLAPAKAIDSLQAPMNRDESGLIRTVVAGRAVELGSERVGRKFECHEVLAMAPLGPGGASAWIDLRGQLWTWDGLAKRCAAVGLSLSTFGVDSNGALHASSKTNQYILESAPNGTCTAKPVQSSRLLTDCAELPSKCGAIAWSRGDERSGSALSWSLDLGAGRSRALHATTNGFDLFAAPAIVLQRGAPCVAIGAKPTRLVAPIQNGEITWSLLVPEDGLAEPPLPRAPGLECKDAQGTVVRVQDSAASVEFAGVRFMYRPGEACFDCNRCLAATGLGDRIITLLGNDELISWSLAANGSLIDPRHVPPTPLPAARAMWPIDGGMVMEAASATENGRERWRWDGVEWKTYLTPRLARTANASWNFVGDDQLTLRGQTYRFQFDRWPSLDFEVMELTGPSPSESLRTERAGLVAYRTSGNRWFRVPQGGMPISCDPPQPVQDAFKLGTLRIDRHAEPGLTSPRCVLSSADAETPVSLCVDNGLIRDIDGWDSNCEIVRIASDRALIRMRASNVFRPVELHDKQIRMLAPVVAKQFIASDHGDPVRQLGRLELKPNHSLRCGDIDLGVPATSGFRKIDPAQFLPLAQRPDGSICYAAHDGVYSLNPSLILDSIMQIDERQFSASAWRRTSRGLEFMATDNLGRSFPVEPMRIASEPTADAGAQECMLVEGMTTPDCYKATRSSNATSMTLVRAHPTPSEITLMSTEAGRIELAHTRATRIEADDAGFVTFSESWVAQYKPSLDVFRLESVVQAKNFRKPIDVKPLGGGLFARRTDGRGWGVRIAEDINAPRWPFGALLGAERTFLADRNTALETTAIWSRSSDLDGTVRKRWGDARAAPIATANAYRSGEIIVSDDARFRIGGDQAIEQSKVDVAPRDRGRFESMPAAPWSIVLAKSGSELQLTHRGIKLSLEDGALPMDFAIAAGAEDSQACLIDRYGTKRLSKSDEPWSAHPAEVRDSLAKNPPNRARAFVSDGSLRRFIGTKLKDTPVALVLPHGTGIEFKIVPLEKSIDSWTRGARLEIQLGTDGMVHFRRASASSTRWIAYPPIKKDDCCSVGRFAFDIPTRLLLAARPGGSKPEACVEMRLGWEWPTSAAGSRSGTALDVIKPTAIEPEFGPIARDQWLSGTDLTPEQLVDAESKAGQPIIWYPFIDRLFLVGDRSVVWIELGDRWRSRSLN